MRLPLRLPTGLSNTASSLLLAFALAVMVWVAATNTELQRISFPLNGRGLPIELVNLPDGMVVIQGNGDEVNVNVLLPRGQEDSVQTSDLVAHADLSGLTPGTQQIEVQVERQPGAPPFRVLNWQPDRIVITVDEVITRQIPIEVSVTDSETVPQIYQVLTPTVNPPTMTLTGPRSLVEPVERVVAEISVDSASATVIDEVVPRLIGSEGEIESPNFTMEPEQVSVVAPIQQRQGYEELIVRAALEGEPARGYWVRDLVVTPQLVSVVGDPAIIEGLNRIVDTAPVDVEGLGEGEVTLPVALELPEGVSPLEDDVVEVTIRIEPQTSSRRVTIVPEYIGLQPGLVVTNVVPSTVDVLLQGPINELDELNLQDIIATLDLTGYAAGTWLVEPRITPPGTLQAESVIPEQVEVTIDEPRGSRQVLLSVNAAGLNARLVAVMDPVSITAELEGPVLPLDNLDISLLSPTVEVSGLGEGTYQLTPTLAFSNGISVLNLLPPVVTVRLFNRADLLVPTVPIEVINLEPGLRATFSAPVAIVRVAGPGTEASLGRNPSFRVAVDAAGLGAGNYSLAPQVRLPNGYVLIGIIPELVEVQLEPDPTATPVASPQGD